MLALAQLWLGVTRLRTSHSLTLSLNTYAIMHSSPSHIGESLIAHSEHKLRVLAVAQRVSDRENTRPSFHLRQAPVFGPCGP